MSRFPKPHSMREPGRPTSAQDATVLRLSCEGCGRNLADVARDFREGARAAPVAVSARPGVNLEAEVIHSDDDGEDPWVTWTARCRCGAQHDFREDRAVKAWADAARRDGRVVRGVLAAGRIVVS